MPLMSQPDEIKSSLGSATGNRFHESANLDILRSMAVITIFGCHFVQISAHLSGKWNAAWCVGQVGLWMFFAHTCIVLMFSLERTLRSGPHFLLSYFVRRVLRIYPLAIFFVFLDYVLDARGIPIKLWRSLTLTWNLSLHHVPVAPPLVQTLWTLPFQIEMSLVLPLFLFFRKRPIVLAWLLWAASIPLAWMQPRLGDAFGIFEFLPAFTGGIIAWRLMRERNPQWLPAWMLPLAIVILSSVAIIINSTTLPYCAAGFSACLAILLPHFPEIQSPTVATLARVIARYSFSIYLAHFPIMLYVLIPQNPAHPMFKYLPPMPAIHHFTRPIHAFLVVALTACASYITYHCIEKPGIDWGHKIARRLAVSSLWSRDRLAEVAS
jgi:peptidoglycan/LPS O-acetylase OafA/YrhL